jgi:hypothetical protein
MNNDNNLRGEDGGAVGALSLLGVFSVVEISRSISLLARRSEPHGCSFIANLT